MEKEGRVSVFRAIFRKSFTRALWLYHAGTGGCNGCDIEVLDVLTPFYDVERLGMKLVGSPRHADVILVIGPVSRQAAPALRRLYESVPDPKVVVAVGACAIGGGIWFDSYANWGGVDKIIPVDYYIPGCPPRPEAIIHGIAVALGLAPKKVGMREQRQRMLEVVRGGKRPLPSEGEGGAPR